MKFCYDLNYKISINAGGLSIDFMIIIRNTIYIYVGIWAKSRIMDGTRLCLLLKKY